LFCFCGGNFVVVVVVLLSICFVVDYVVVVDGVVVALSGEPRARAPIGGALEIGHGP
jgi:hypothetical protein